MAESARSTWVDRVTLALSGHDVFVRNGTRAAEPSDRCRGRRRVGAEKLICGGSLPPLLPVVPVGGAVGVAHGGAV
jgi:hypothetical protein